METLGLCRPSSLILLISVAAVIYHAAVGAWSAVVWWIMVGLFGTGIFQALCFGGLEPVAWVLMLIPVMVVCFFMAVALFASRMRITNVLTVPCDRSPTCGCPRCLETAAPAPQVGCSSGFCE
jgi:hypothetical protein